MSPSIDLPSAPAHARRPPGLRRLSRRRRPPVRLGRHAERVHRALLLLPRHAPVERHEHVTPERAAGRPARRRRDVRRQAAQIVHRRQPQVQLGPLAQPRLRALRRRRQRGHAGTADAGFGAAAPSVPAAPGAPEAEALRSSASPFCAAIAIGSNSAPIGGEKMFSIHARSSSVAPRLAANARKSQRSLTPSPPWIWPPTSFSEPGSASSLTCVFVAPGKYRARDTPTPLARTYGMPIACASVSPTEKPPIVYSPATRPHGTHTGS